MPNVKSPNPYKNTNYNKPAQRPHVVARNIDYGDLYFKACSDPTAMPGKRLRLLAAYIANPTILRTNQTIDDDA